MTARASITELLTLLNERLVRGHRPSAARLRPGLTPPQIQALWAGMPFTPPADVVELYAFADGMDDGVDAWELLPGARWFPLHEALERYRGYASVGDPEYRPPEILPIMGGQTHELWVWCAPGPRQGTVHDGPHAALLALQYDSLAELIRTVLESEEAGAYIETQHGLEPKEPEARAIRVRNSRGRAEALQASLAADTFRWEDDQQVRELYALVTKRALPILSERVDRALDGDGRDPALFPGLMVLGVLQDPAALPVLLKALGHPLPTVQATAVDGLRELGDRRSIGPLLDLLKRGSSWSRDRRGAPDLIRSRIVFSLARVADAQVVEVALTLLQSKDAELRRMAASMLGAQADLRAVDPLCKCLVDPDLAVASEAAVALGKLGDVRAVPHLLHAMERGIEDPRLEQLGARGLGSSDYPAANFASALGALVAPETGAAIGAWLDELLKVLEGRASIGITVIYAHMSGLLARAFCRDGGPRADLVRHLRWLALCDREVLGLDGHMAWPFRYAQAQHLTALLRLGHPEGMEEIDARCRRGEARHWVPFLEGTAAANALSFLELCLLDRDQRVRERAAQTLFEHPVPDAGRLLAMGLDDECGIVRWRCARALASLKLPESKPALRAGLDDPNLAVAFECQLALRSMGDHSSAQDRLRKDALLRLLSEP